MSFPLFEGNRAQKILHENPWHNPPKHTKIHDAFLQRGRANIAEIVLVGCQTSCIEWDFCTVISGDLGLWENQFLAL